ncbi:2-dehydropantoate 2-reductase [Vibrio marisflavi]|nr:2-dehydropantoate 2-reductase [Vibrio marisflavi]
MNIVVLGPGAIGSLWAIHLKKAGHNVSLWGNKTQSTDSIQLEDKPPILFDNRNTQALSQADLVLVTVKVWQVEHAIKPIIQHLDSDCMLMFMHNGMGAVDRIYHLVEQHPVLLATTTHGAFRPSANRVNHTGLGQTQVGAFNDKAQQCEFIADVLNHAQPEVFWNQNIKQALWQKLVVNCAINPLTGIEQCQNGQLANQEYQTTIEKVVSECADVMNADGFKADKQTLLDTVRKVIVATGKNYSSMYQDVFYNRTTEIDFITGYLLERAKCLHIATPVNAELYQQIKAKELSEN